jgi:hypothetical protein
MPSRRTVLSGAGVLGMAALSGCSDVLDRDPQYLHFVTVSNVDDAPHDVAFDVYDGGERLYSYAKTLPANHVEEDHVFDGTPARVVATVDGSESVERSWNVGACGSNSGGKSGLLLGVSGRPDSSQTAELNVDWTCQSIARDSGYQTDGRQSTTE